MIDKAGNLITECKYLLDTYFFGDFAIVFEGGTWKYYNVVIKDGEYIEDYITLEEKYSPKYTDGAESLSKAKYVGGGKWSAIDYEGNPITIPNTELEKVKESLLAK